MTLQPGRSPEGEHSAMKQNAMTAFKALLLPVFRRPEYVQAAALCVRSAPDGLQVLLISTLNSKRWITPKGWPMADHTLAEAAQQEAWEEAGVRGVLRPEAVGDFAYRKMIKQGIPVACRCQVYRIDVEALADVYPESHRRKREWFSPAEAAARVDEPELQAILRAL